MERMHLAVGWTIVIAFIITTALTLLGLIGVVQLPPEFLSKLFYALIVEIIGCGLLLFRRSVRQADKTSPEKEYFTEASTLFKSAIQAKKEQDYEKADRYLGELLALPTENLPFEIRRVFLERGEIAVEKRLWQNAVNSYAVYYEIQPDNLDALIKYGKALRYTNQFEEALRIYERAKQLSPNNYDVLNGLQNITRRMAGFFKESDRTDVADTWFERTRDVINTMIKMSTRTNSQDKRYLNAVMARARLYWQWERYPETIAALREIIAEFPDFADAKEDLGAVLLELGQRESLESAIDEAKDMYRALFQIAEGVSKVFVGAGYAEATALAASSTPAQLKEAEQAVLLSLAKIETAEEDPYPFYAAAQLFHRCDRRGQAIDYLQRAIKQERRRSSDPYRFDYVRLVKYEKLLQRWQDSSLTAI